MAKPKDRNEVEYLRGLVRELKSENRHLKKQLGNVKKRAGLFDDNLPEDKEDIEPVITIKNINTCPDCGGELEIIDIAVKNLIICTGCGARRTEAK